MANALAVSLHASGAETVTGSGAAVDIGALRSVLTLQLQVLAVAGTAPTLAITIESSPTSTGPWRVIDTLSTVSTTGVTDRSVAGLDRYVRCSWVITGSLGQSFTFSVTGSAHVVYAGSKEVARLALPPAALEGVDAQVIADLAVASSDECDGYLGAAYTLPLAAWGSDLRMHAAKILGCAIMMHRGFDPAGTDALIVKGRDDAISWLKGIMKGEIEPPEIIDSEPEVYDAGVYTMSAAKRGW